VAPEVATWIKNTILSIPIQDLNSSSLLKDLSQLNHPRLDNCKEIEMQLMMSWAHSRFQSMAQEETKEITLREAVELNPLPNLLM
jgi:hypothetical protein